MYHLPQKFKAELYKEFDFTREFVNETALLHNWNEGRILITPLPPFRQGSIELYVNKAVNAQAELIVMVLPCDTSTEWFHKILELQKPVAIRFTKGRLRYEGESKDESRFKHRVPACTIIIDNTAGYSHSERREVESSTRVH